MYGEYGPHVHPKYAQKPLLGLQRLSNNVRYESACADFGCSAYDAEKVKQVVSEADLIIFTMIGGKYILVLKQDLGRGVGGGVEVT